MMAAELACSASITAATASGHPAKPTQGESLAGRGPSVQAPLFGLASAGIARMLGSIGVVTFGGLNLMRA